MFTPHLRTLMALPPVIAVMLLGHTPPTAAEDLSGLGGTAPKVATGRPATQVTKPPASPTVAYYVDSAGGSDAAGGTSPGTAWRTLERASQATLAPGEHLLLARGSSWTGRLRISESGTATHPIRLGAYGTGAAPVVTGSCVDLSGSHIDVTGIAVRDCAWAGFAAGGDDITITGVSATGSVAGVHVRSGADRVTVRDSVLARNDRMSVNTVGGDDDSGAWGVLVNGDRARVTGNRFSGNVAMSHDYGADGAAVEIYGAVGTRVTHNTSTDDNAFVELGNSRTEDTVLAYNTVVSARSDARFLITPGPGSSFGPVVGTVAEHNSVRLTGSGSEGFVCYSGCSAEILTMRANVISAVLKVGYAQALTSRDNVWHGGQRQFPLGAGDVVADPRWAAPAAGDLHLLAGSPAVDRRSTTGAWRSDRDGRRVPLDGNSDGVSRPDAGAFERSADVRTRAIGV